MTQRTTKPHDVRKTAALFVADEIRKAMHGEQINETNDLPLAIQLILKDKASVRNVGLLAMRTLGEMAVAQVKHNLEAPIQ